MTLEAVGVSIVLGIVVGGVLAFVTLINTFVAALFRVIDR